MSLDVCSQHSAHRAVHPLYCVLYTIVLLRCSAVQCMHMELCMHCTVYLLACAFAYGCLHGGGLENGTRVYTRHQGAYMGSGRYTGWALIGALR